ncbi:MAG: hypothetical protein OXC46_00170 [Thaumarchaeota archaeon]|nr:hypothetical protein [Nitrososphaerota archaeon]
MSEEIVGKAGIYDNLEGGSDPFGSRFRCPNCRGGSGTKKFPLHCKVVNGEPKITCNNKECNCPCRTHYACKSCGHLHAYGSKCDTPRHEPTPVSKGMQEAIDAARTLAENQREQAAKTILKEVKD